MEEAHTLPDVRIKTEPGFDESSVPCDQQEKGIDHPAGPSVWTIVKSEEFSTEAQPVVCKINISPEQLRPDYNANLARRQPNSSVNADCEADVTFRDGGVLDCASEEKYQKFMQSGGFNEEKGTEKRNTVGLSRLNRKRSLIVKRARFIKRRAKKSIEHVFCKGCPPLRKRSALSTTTCHVNSRFTDERLKTQDTSSFCDGTCSLKMGSFRGPPPGAVSLSFPSSGFNVTTRPTSSNLTIPCTPSPCGNTSCAPRSTSAASCPDPTPVQIFCAHEPSNGNMSGFDRSHACSDVSTSPAHSHDSFSSPSASHDSQQSQPLTFPRFGSSGQNQIPSGQAFSELFKLVSGMTAHIQRLEYKVDSLLGRPRSMTVAASTQTDGTNFGYGGLASGGPSSVNSLSSAIAADLAPVIVPENPIKQPVPQLSQSSQPELVAPVKELPFIDDRFWLIRPEQLSAQVTRDLLTQLTSSIVRFEPNCESLDLSDEELATILRKSHSATSMARYLVYHCFTLGELFGRNATGVNYTGSVGQKKKAINQKKLQELVALVRSHYDQEGLEKIIYTVINKSILYLWSRKLKHPWLYLVEV